MSVRPEPENCAGDGEKRRFVFSACLSKAMCGGKRRNRERLTPAICFFGKEAAALYRPGRLVGSGRAALPAALRMVAGWDRGAPAALDIDDSQDGRTHSSGSPAVHRGGGRGGIPTERSIV